MKMENCVFKNSYERLVIFIDFHNLEASLRNEGHQVDMPSLRNYLSEGRWLLESFCYIGFNPKNSDADENSHHFLRSNGFMVKTKAAKIRHDGSLKCDLDVELVLDVVDYVSQAKPDIVLLVTGDGDFAPLATWLRHRGIRVEVASTRNSLSQDLAEAASGYINLSEALEHIEKGGEEISFQREEVMTNGNGYHQRPESGDPIHVQ